MRLTQGDRTRHIWLVAPSGTGKSNLLSHLILQDIYRGYGACLIDPDNDTAALVLDHIPAKRVRDTLYFEPPRILVGLNPFAGLANDEERNRVVEDLVVMFRRLSESWGQRMDSIFKNAFSTLVRIPGANLLNLYDLLKNDVWRNDALEHLDPEQDSYVLDFWRTDFQKAGIREGVTNIVTRLTDFVTAPYMRRIFGGKDSLDFQEIMDSRRILIVNLGHVGESNILGSIIVSRFQLEARRRVAVPQNKRVPFHLYIDEFQNLVNLSGFERILTHSRKFNLCLTLSNQRRGQVKAILDALEGIGTTIEPFIRNGQRLAKVTKDGEERVIKPARVPVAKASHRDLIIERTQTAFPVTRFARVPAPSKDEDIRPTRRRKDSLES